MVEETLNSLIRWYDDCLSDNERSSLLSKLAILELCGYLEEWMDAFVIEIGAKHGLSEDWVREEIVRANFGFNYKSHLRGMLCKVIGESGVKKIEQEFCGTDPSKLERLRSPLGTLWKKRCEFAHDPISKSLSAATVFDAPTWTMAQYRSLNNLLNDYKLAADVVFP